MSGPPVWLPYDLDGPHDPPHTPVVGIFIEYHRSDQCLVATDIGFAINAILGR
jgi:hypothetical protein